MAEHRARGERVCIISASPAYVVEPVAAALDADALCTRLAAVDGRLTGTLDGPMMHGQNKVVAARAYAAAHGVELSACRFYSDSVSDLPLLSAVGQPVAVNADPGLARHARRAGWRRERWTD